MRRFLFFCELAGKGVDGQEAGNGKIKALSRDARQVIVCTSLSGEAPARTARHFVSRLAPRDGRADRRDLTPIAAAEKLPTRWTRFATWPTATLMFGIGFAAAYRKTCVAQWIVSDGNPALGMKDVHAALVEMGGASAEPRIHDDLEADIGHVAARHDLIYAGEGQHRLAWPDPFARQQCPVDVAHFEPALLESGSRRLVLEPAMSLLDNQEGGAPIRRRDPGEMLDDQKQFAGVR